LINLEKARVTQANFNRLLRPGSIALIGASATPGSLGECVLDNLEKSGYAGKLHLVNPKRPVIRGRASLGSIEELPEGIDCAVLAIPGAAVLASARACAQRGIGSLIVFSAGFAEGGEEGREAQCELSRIAAEHGMLLEGPNCLGMVNYVDRIPLTFVATWHACVGSGDCLAERGAGCCDRGEHAPPQDSADVFGLYRKRGCEQCGGLS
jgi:acyl-CoA synthetase (NDP forming)